MNDRRKAELFDDVLRWLDESIHDSTDFMYVTENKIGITHEEMKELGYYGDEENDDGGMAECPDEEEECFSDCPCRCFECEHACECGLDSSIPCSPDCVNITRDGKVRIGECMLRQCGAADIVANAVLEKSPHGTVTFSDGTGKFPESYTEGDAVIFTGLFGKVVDYPFRLDAGTYYSCH